jgi:hypothetical protein
MTTQQHRFVSRSLFASLLVVGASGVCSVSEADGPVLYALADARYAANYAGRFVDHRHQLQRRSAEEAEFAAFDEGGQAYSARQTPHYGTAGRRADYLRRSVREEAEFAAFGPGQRTEAEGLKLDTPYSGRRTDYRFRMYNQTR